MKFSFLSIILVFTLIISACKDKSSLPTKTDEHDELLEDKAELEQAYNLQKKISAQVFASKETEPVAANISDDAADDPSIWYNPAQPSESIIFGSNKKGGIVAYDLQGKKLAYYEVGNVNNLDVIYGFPHGEKSIDILGASNRSSQGIDLFEISKDGILQSLLPEGFPMDSKIDDVYGFCFGKTPDGKHYAIINGKNGVVRQYEIVSKNDAVDLQLAREIALDSQPEGMVTSQNGKTLYIGEEQLGIWQIGLHPDSTSKSLLTDSGEKNLNIKYDVEGLALLKTDSIEWLIASSQGNFSYAVFDVAAAHKYLGSFIIADGTNIDGAQETDGIEVSSDSLSTEFPKGVFMAQDGFNYDGEKQKAQNFKYVDVRAILELFEK